MAKLYVIPVELACNARCPYCVNQFRNLGNSFLSVGDLEKCLYNIGSLDAIEITGGGEPTLHSQIEKIIDLCVEKTRTQLYSNAELLKGMSKNVLKSLNPLCISRAHFDSTINQAIMGINYGDEIFSRGLNIKLSAVLLKGGIESPEDVENYIGWARGKARKIVFRPLFSDVVYSREVTDKVVTLDSFISYFNLEILGERNPQININGVDVEFEIRSCSCENTNLILHADGKLNCSWSENDSNWARN